MPCRHLRKSMFILYDRDFPDILRSHVTLISAAYNLSKTLGYKQSGGGE